MGSIIGKSKTDAPQNEKFHGKQTYQVFHIFLQFKKIKNKRKSLGTILQHGKGKFNQREQIIRAATSAHTGGVNLVMFDGSATSDEYIIGQSHLFYFN